MDITVRIPCLSVSWHATSNWLIPVDDAFRAYHNSKIVAIVPYSLAYSATLGVVVTVTAMPLSIAAITSALLLIAGCQLRNFCMRRYVHISTTGSPWELGNRDWERVKNISLFCLGVFISKAWLSTAIHELGHVLGYAFLCNGCQPTIHVDWFGGGHTQRGALGTPTSLGERFGPIGSYHMMIAAGPLMRVGASALAALASRKVSTNYCHFLQACSIDWIFTEVGYAVGSLAVGDSTWDYNILREGIGLHPAAAASAMFALGWFLQSMMRDDRINRNVKYSLRRKPDYLSPIVKRPWPLRHIFPVKTLNMTIGSKSLISVKLQRW